MVAPGTIKQQLKLFIPGTIESTAAANPAMKVGRYFFKNPIPLLIQKNNLLLFQR